MSEEEMNMTDEAGVTRLVAGLQSAIASDPSALTIESALRQFADASGDAGLAEHVGRLAMAFGYYPSPGKTPYWGPMMVLADGRQYPADLDSIDADVPQLWASVLDHKVAPVAEARLADLLWGRRHGEHPFIYGTRAIDAYLILASDPGDGIDRLYRVDDASRAISLARELNDKTRIGAAGRVLVELATKELAEEEPAPGVVLGALEPLVPDCPPKLVADRQALLVAAVETYESDPFNFQSASELLVLTLPVSERPDQFRRIVDRWEEAADAADGLMRLLHLERAIEIAKLHEISDRLDDLRLKVQRIEKSDLGLQPIQHEVEIAGMDLMLGLLVHDSWAGTLSAIGSYGPPTGTRDANVDALDGQRGAAPFQAAISKTKLGFGNAIIWRADAGTADRDRLDLAEIETFRSTYTSHYVMAAMHQAEQELGTPTAEVLADILTTDHIERWVAEKFAKGIGLYLEGEYELAALVLLPYIESAVRHLNTQAGLVVITEPRGVRPGGVKTLGALLSQMANFLDTDWTRYLESTLTDPLGRNLRNRALHGLVDHFSQSDVALLVQIVCFLATLQAS